MTEENEHEHVNNGMGKKKFEQTIFDALSLSKDKHKQANYTRLNAANKYFECIEWIDNNNNKNNNNSSNVREPNNQ